MLNHAFLITAHAFLDQLEEIIKLLNAPNHFFFVNIDKKTQADAFMEQCKGKYPQVTFLEGKERMEVAHGGYSQIETTLRLLRKAVGGGVISIITISFQDRISPASPTRSLTHSSKSIMEPATCCMTHPKTALCGCNTSIRLASDLSGSMM